MTKPHGTVDGRPVDLIGQPLHPGIGSRPGVGITRKETATMPKAEQNGRYVLNGHYFRIRKGDVLPEGAEMVEERKEEAAPENRKLDAAPENRSKRASKKDAD